MEVVTPGVLQCPCEDSGFPMRLDTLLLVCRIAPQLPTLLLLCGTHIWGLKTQIFVFFSHSCNARGWRRPLKDPLPPLWGGGRRQSQRPALQTTASCGAKDLLGTAIPSPLPSSGSHLSDL